MTIHLSGRQLAMQNELAVLYYLRSFGHLRRAELGQLVWPNSSEESRKKMLQRTLKRLFEKKLVLEKVNALGGGSLVLSAGGAKALSERGLEASAGTSIQGIQGPTFWHRTLGTAYLADRASQEEGTEVFGEYALNRGYAPLSNGEFKVHFGKVPDGLVLVPGKTRGLAGGYLAADWVEVESSYKPKEERRRVLDVGSVLGTMLPGTDIVLDRLVILYVPDQGHDRRMLASARAWVKRQQDRGAYVEALTQSICVAEAEVDFPLKWKGTKEYTLQDLLDRRAGAKPGVPSAKRQVAMLLGR